MHIVLVEPEIPTNTGNIARTCAVSGSSLHLIKPLGFSVEDKYLKRAGLDYWQHLDIHYYDSFSEFEDVHKNARIICASTKSKKLYHNMSYNYDDFFVFGKETKGLPADILEKYKDTTVRIPMGKEIRSLNLGNSVAIMIFEALRQLNFPNLV